MLLFAYFTRSQCLHVFCLDSWRPAVHHCLSICLSTGNMRQAAGAQMLWICEGECMWSSEQATDSTVPTPRNEPADGVQGAIGVCINKATTLLAAVSPAAAVTEGDGDGDGHAYGDGNGDGDGDGTSPQPDSETSTSTTGIGLTASVDAAEQLAARIRQRSAQIGDHQGDTSGVQHVG